uniref:Serpin domain-containing protein n=1 Tax=Anas platyrhynchos TaxID=8839 RepID=A0A8B9QKY5_ANAPL
MEALNKANTNFALDFFKHQCQEDGNKNILFAPLSISSVLATVYLGAKGNTADQMAKVSLGPERSERTEIGKSGNIHTGFKALNLEINKPNKNYMLKSVNQLYGEKSLPFSKEYLQLAKKYYNAEPQAVDFMGAANEIRREINSRVEEQTEGKIQNLLPPGSIDSLTRLVLVNALYFKGTWATKFEAEATRQRPFRINTVCEYNALYIRLHVEKTVKKMDERISCHSLNPQSIKIKELTFENLSAWTSPELMEKMKVELYLPRFTVEEKYNLKSALSKMGIQDAFTEGQADFTGMSEKDNLVLSQVFHKCYVEVNEEGTEAAAASSAALTSRSLGAAIIFVADHPFLFFIRHNSTKCILFLGRFCSP